MNRRMFMEEMILDFKPASRPGVPNINNNVYTRENLLDIINDDHVKYMIKNHILTVQFMSCIHPDINTIYYPVAPDYSIGYVIEWNENNIKVNITDSKAKQWFSKNSADDYVLGMRMIAEKDNFTTNDAECIKILRVMCFDLLEKESMSTDYAFVSFVSGKVNPSICICSEGK
jgi:hypothetical protein